MASRGLVDGTHGLGWPAHAMGKRAEAVGSLASAEDCLPAAWDRLPTPWASLPRHGIACRGVGLLAQAMGWRIVLIRVGQTVEAAEALLIPACY
jgi:hypothetical protein